MADSSPIRVEQLASCALLLCFDRDSLGTLLGCDPEQAEQLMGGPEVEPFAAGYRLRAEVAAAALSWLRAERPAAEAEFHQRAFSFYLERLQRLGQSERALTDEDCCVYHLGALFMLLGAQMQWQSLLDSTLAARATALRQPRHTQRLTMIEGYVAGRTQRYDTCDALLTELLHEADLEPDVRAKALKGLADAALYRSQYERAIDLYQQLYTAAGAADDPIYQGLALLNMGMCFHELERHDQALAHCARSSELFRTHGDRVREAYACYHTALYSLYLGRWEQAEASRADAARLFEDLGLPNYLGFVYWMEGYLKHIFGDLAASEAAYLRALPLAESPEFGQPSLALDTWLYLGFLYATQERWELALEHYRRAEVLATQIDRRQSLYTIYYRRGQIYQRQGQLDAAWQSYDQALTGVESLRSETHGEDVKISLLGTTQQMYEAMVLLYLARGQEAEAFHTVERARSRAFLDLLAQHKSSLPGAFEQQVVTLDEVQAQLPEGALLLEYFTIGVLPRSEHLINQIPAARAELRAQLTFPPQVLLFAVSRSQCIVRRLTIDPNQLRPQIGDRFPGRHLLHGRLPQHLYHQLIAPAAALLASCDTLYVIPHGPLHYVPFSALCSAPGEYLLRAEGPSLAQAPSATILLLNCLNKPSGGGELLALGYNDPDGTQPLRFAEAEAQLIADALAGTAWIDPQPKSQRLATLPARTRWLHIAGHARFEPDDPLGSTLRLGRDDDLSARAIISDLRLAVDLVSLSSCTSGVSHVVPGDELLGLQRAFLYAGAPTVVCTQWEAYDLVALLVMSRFYAGLKLGLTPGIALRDAQIAVRELRAEDLTTLLASWRAEGGLISALLGETLQTAATTTGRPFADPLMWAPFMLIGRASAPTP